MKIKVIVNPRSGKGTAQHQLERIMGKLLLDGTASHIDITRTECRGHATETAMALAPNSYDLVIACGGDGTINEVANGIIKGKNHLPLAILAAGTSNDFAYSLQLPDHAAAFCRMVREGRFCPVDVGCANGRYFMNVASFGMFTSVAHKTEQDQKNLLGKAAYYLEGIKNAPLELTNHLPLAIRSDEFSAEGNYQICMIANSMSVGTMRRLMYQADVNDGKFDVLLLPVKKRENLPSAARAISVVLKAGEAILELQADEALSKLSPKDFRESFLFSQEKDPAYIYFQTSHIEISSTAPVPVDLDGESFGTLPLTVDVHAGAIRLLVPGSKQRLQRLPLSQKM